MTGRPFHGLAVVLLVTAVAFAPALSNQFTNWDDDVYVTGNAYIQDEGAGSVSTLFARSTIVSANYHPLTLLSLALNHRVSGLEPFAYHATDLLLHLLNTLLVFVFFTALCRGRSEIGLIVALFFGIHPMHVESVAWISARKDVLYVFFFLSSLIAYLGTTRSELSPRARLACHVATALLFAASALAKPAAVVLPVVLLLIDHFRERPLTRRLVLEKLPLFAISLWIGLETIRAQSGVSAIAHFASYSIPERFAIACHGIAIYLIKAVAPFGLSAFHPYPEQESGLPLAFWLAPPFVAAIAALVLRSARTTRAGVFGALFFLVTVALTLQFVSVGSAVIAERYTYLSYLGPFFIVATAYSAVLHGGGPAWRARAFAAVLAVFALGFAFLTHQRTQVWHDSETLWSDVIAAYPGRVSVAHYNRANARRTRGELEEALADYAEAIAIWPDYADAHNNRGNALLDLERDEEAIESYTRALEIDPEMANALANRGAALGRVGDREGALRDFARAIEVDAAYPHTWANRAQIMLNQGRNEEAIADLDAHLALQPENHQAYYARGIARRRLRDYRASLADFDQALRLRPDAGQYRLARSLSLEGLGRFEDALEEARAALRAGAQVQTSYVERLERLRAAGADGETLAKLRRAAVGQPDDLAAQLALAEHLAERRALAEAEAVLRAAVARWPCDKGLRTRLIDVALRARGRAAQVTAIDAYLAACDSPPDIMNDLAYLLATAREPEVRDGARALALIERAIEVLGEHPLVLDTLAVAQAETGRLDDAVATAKRAVDEGSKMGLPAEAMDILRDHHARLSAGKPVRE